MLGTLFFLIQKANPDIHLFRRGFVKPLRKLLMLGTAIYEGIRSSFIGHIVSEKAIDIGISEPY
jgi:hypothetical protein